MRAAVLATMALLGCEPAPLPRGADGGPASSAVVPPVPPPPSTMEGTVARVARREDVALQGPRVEAKADDWVVKNAGSVAVIGSEKGRLIDFGPEGGADGLYYVDSASFDALDRMHVEVSAIEAGDGGRALHVVRRVLDKPLVQHVWYTFAGPALVVETVLASTSAKEVLAVTQGEILSWGNVPTWVEGHGFITTGGSFGGEVVARESHGLSYAACSRTGRMMARFSSPDLPGFHPSAKTGEIVETVPAGGSSIRRSIVLVHSTSSLGDAAMALPCRTGPRERWALPEGAPPGSNVEVARCGDEEKNPFLRFAVDPGGKRRSEIELPGGGCFSARVVAPGHAPGKWLARDALPKDTAALPRAGRLRWKITDRIGGAIMPAKIVVRGIDKTPDPDWGEDGENGAALHSVHAVAAGELPIPPGRYQVTVTRGPEWTLDERKIDVKEGATTEISAALERVVETKGWIAADLHVHAMPSFDAPARLEDRVRSLAAVGVELAVATDHNVITDYGPAIASEKLGEHLASIVGDEVTTRDVYFGHFNVFPLAPGAAPLPADSVAPAKVFAAARAAAPDGLATVVQVNHPRMGDIGYLELLRVDARDVSGSVRRASFADMSFDALEVFNGDHYAEIKKVERCLGDWYALLNGGYRTVATGNSDSHKVTYQEAGIPRTWVAVPDDRPASFDTRSFLDALRAGKAIVSSGPFVRISAGDQGPGGAAKEGDVQVRVDVDAPSWVHVSKIELVVRGKTKKTWEVPAGAKDTKRFSGTHTEKLVRGDWIVAVVRGEEPMKHLHREGAKPFAFTNPIWVE